ncbi:MAG: arginine--tRNA ligase [Alphaproteobacteria bacterium]|nr:arginine--tRNA ligase [Alphaproteobacteria bacterium]
MNIFNLLLHIIKVEIESLSMQSALPAGLALDNVAATPPREAGHGDIAINAAMVLAKQAKMPPRQIAEILTGHLESVSKLKDIIARLEIAGPGFINLFLKDTFWHAQLADILTRGTRYGDSTVGNDERVNVEFVSANPTGPLHVGHGRGAVFGDALVALLKKAGYAVSREYYINDAGGQVDALARSLYFRYREACGETPGAMPHGIYPGEYLLPPAAALRARDGDKWLALSEAEWLPALRVYAIEAMLDLIRADLARLGIGFDRFFSERSLHAAGSIEAALQRLNEAGVIYTGTLEPPKGMLPDDWEPRPQTLFRATAFGDDVDRPLKKSDGSWTYFASDIAYHFDKVNRGFTTLIDVWGADHGGYIKRVKAAIKALAGDRATLDVKICNMVRVLDGGVPVKMSKRSGDFVTLKDVVDAVGKDAVRFIMLTRRNDAMLDFDLSKVLEQSRENPVFYVQYAHARACSVARRLKLDYPAFGLATPDWSTAPLARLTHPAEIAIIRRLAQWPDIVEGAAKAHEPHRIAFFLYDLAGDFHAHWNSGNDEEALRFIVPTDRDLSFARLALVQGVATVIASGLEVMGVTPVEEMR